jgi:cytosine/adenosine deaminase-related metal-dependent hydrolase
MRPTLYRAEWVLPVATPPVRDGAVLVDAHGRIAAVGPAAAMDAPDHAEIVTFDHAALIPGLVNVHAHPELAMFRGALEDLPFRDWILRLVGAKRAALKDDDYAAAARWTAVEALRAGITTLGATEASGAALAALAEAGMRGIVYLEGFGPEPATAGAAMAELRSGVERLRGEETDLVRLGVSPHAPYTVSDRLFAEVAAWALAEGIPIAIHAAESAAERALVVDGGGDFAPGLRARGIQVAPRGRSTIEMLDRLGVLRARPLLIHCVRVDPDDIARIADSGSAVAHCPIANARLGHGVAPLPGLRAAGVRVGIGTDSVASNNRLDLLDEARAASLLQRATLRDPSILPPDELLRLCTLDGARALGVDDRTGSLEPGKDADLCVVSLASSHARPVFDPATAVLHAARGADVRMTVVAGRILYRDGRVATLDEDSLAARVEDAASRVGRAIHPDGG